ncbi:MAG: iron-sulfur cluster co-chaperone HscB C-terminal domain-containing protein [Planctomycetota bacterium]
MSPSDAIHEPTHGRVQEMAACPQCASPVETPLGCPSCGTLFHLEKDPDPFEAIGLAARFRVDPEDLRRRMLRFSRMTHPDFFATAGPEVKERAERASAILNAAHAVVMDDAARADWLIGSLDGPDENEERAMPKEFLLEVLEWNELLEEARSIAAVSQERLASLRSDLERRRDGALASVASFLDPLPARGSPALREARRELNVVRYVDRTLGELEALRLSRAAAR